MSKKLPLASLTVAFNEEELIGGCLDLLDVACKLVLIPSQTFSGREIARLDDTEKIAKSKGAIVIFIDAKTEPEARNFGLSHLNKLGYEYALVVDADEYWPQETQRQMARIIAKKPADAYKANLDFFFKRPNWKIDGMKNTRAIVAIRTNMAFSKSHPRRFSGMVEHVNPGTIYHFSYVRSPQKIKEKINSFSHAGEIKDGWYDEVYLKFTPDSKNFHPVNPNEYPECVECKLPREIAGKIPKHLWSA